MEAQLRQQLRPGRSTQDAILSMEYSARETRNGYQMLTSKAFDNIEFINLFSKIFELFQKRID